MQVSHGVGENGSVAHRKACAFPVAQMPLVVHLRRRDLRMPHRPLHGLNRALALQRLRDERRPCGVGAGAQRRTSLPGVVVEEVIHLPRVERLPTIGPLDGEQKRHIPLAPVAAHREVSAQHDVQFLVNRHPQAFPAFHREFQAEVAAVLKEVPHLQVTHLGNPAAGEEEDMQDRGITGALECRSVGGIEHAANLVRREGGAHHLRLVHARALDAGRRVPHRKLPFAEMLE